MDRVGVLGAVVLVAVLSIVALVAILRARYDGRLRTAGGCAPADQSTTSGDRRKPFVAATFADVGISVPAGRVTVVQFTGEFCAVCPQARTLVDRVLLDHPDVAHVEVDVAEHPDAVRTFDIRRTPTMIIVDGFGAPMHRVSGMPREAELRRAVGDLAGRR